MAGARTHAGYSADDIDDPYGLDDEAYAETAEVLGGLLGRLVNLAWPQRRPANRSSGRRPS